MKTMFPTELPAMIFNQPYSICPAHPEGTKWSVSMRSRFGSLTGWNMETFADALTYLRQQLKREARQCHGDTFDFWGFIDGPGGRLEWQTIEQLVRS